MLQLEFGVVRLPWMFGVTIIVIMSHHTVHQVFVYVMNKDQLKQERCEPFQDDRELLWVWMRTGLDENGFGRERVWTRTGLDEKGFGPERVWTRMGLDQNGFGPERVWTRMG